MQEAQQVEVPALIGLGQLNKELGLVVVEHPVDGVAVIAGEDHRQVEHGHLRDKGGHRRGLTHHDVDAAALDLPQQVGVAPQVAVGVVVDGQPALGDLGGLGGHQLAEELAGGALAGGVGGNQLHPGQVAVGAVDAGVGVVEGGDAAGGQGQGRGGGEKKEPFFHTRRLLTD